MPPIRNITAPKPLKTERTHEENQERAYIAASRRSDRSLEARVESARRASEIHKRRTGRSLRVTEQDVINEEMYEEEDDDLPLQYRRLTAHLNTNSADFNRRMAAYLTNHVAMRNALDQAIQSSYAQQYPNGQPWSQGLQSPQSSWASNLSPTQQQQQQQFFSQLSPQLNRPSPYPLPGQLGYRASFSSAVPGNGSSPSQNSQQPSTENPPTDLQRRESAPAPSSGATTTQNLTGEGRPASTSGTDQASTQSHPNTQSLDTKMMPGDGNPAEHPWFGRDWSAQTQSSNLLTTSLPAETQMALYPHNLHPQTSNKGDKTQQPFYAYNPPQFTKSSRTNNMYDGIHQTLAPSVLDTNQTSNTWSTPTTASEDSVVTPFDNTFTFEGSFWPEPFTKPSGNASPYSAYGSGAVTPGENEWAAFINTSSWDDGTSQE